MLSDFCKNQIEKISNESKKTRLKKSMVQTDTDNNMNAINEINYNYARTNKKGIILLPESL